MVDRNDDTTLLPTRFIDRLLNQPLKFEGRKLAENEEDDGTSRTRKCGEHGDDYIDSAASPGWEDLTLRFVCHQFFVTF